jgi:hypothetical protein
MIHLLRRLAPRSIKTHIRHMLKTEAQGIIDANTLLGLSTALEYGRESGSHRLKRRR